MSETQVHKTERVTLHHGDCLGVLRGMAAESVDAVVTDPPYGLSFMGKRWDYDVPAVEVWAECLRVLKPGGHLLAFAGTRTQHRMAVRIEDAGFEIRDMLAWVYGSGFPKSHDVSKAMDKAAGAEREVIGPAYKVPNARAVNPHFVAMVERRGDEPAVLEYAATAPATAQAKQWSGWGTALKPALEPITMARKPLGGTVAENVTRWGTGAVNVDGCRVEVGADDPVNNATWTSRPLAIREGTVGFVTSNADGERRSAKPHAAGRWPANFIHDGHREVCKLLGESYRFFYTAKAGTEDRDDGCAGLNVKQYSHDGRETPIENAYQRNNSVARNHHPTVKPTDLMRYLVRLVTPPGGVVLDPFMGSGSTGRGAMLEGMRFVGIEREAEYVEIARCRIGTIEKPTEREGGVPRAATLFAE